MKCRRLSVMTTFASIARRKIVYRDAIEHLFLKQQRSLGGGQSKFRREARGDREEFETAMPRSGDPFEALLGDRMHERLGGGTLRPEVDKSCEEHARIEEDAHGQRLRSSSINAATSTFGRSPAPTVGRATRRRPTFTRRGRAAVRVRRRPNSSSVISSSDPGARPARSRSAAGITTRPALSMVVRMALQYHPPRVSRRPIETNGFSWVASPFRL